MNRMAHRSAVVLVVAAAVLGGGAILPACSPFSGSDKSGPASEPDGGVVPSGGVDFETCTGRIHVTQDFEGPAFPPQGWTDESYPPVVSNASVSHEMTITNSGKGSLKAHTVSDLTGEGGMLRYGLQGGVPRGIRVKYAYKSSTATLSGSAAYAEIGCDIDFDDSPDISTEIAFDKGDASLGLVKASQGLNIGFESDSWHQVTQELRLDPTNPKAVSASLHASVSAADGRADSADVAATLTSVKSVSIYCGIPFTQNSAASTTIDAYVDDIVIDVCP